MGVHAFSEKLLMPKGSISPPFLIGWRLDLRTIPDDIRRNSFYKI
jgi:nitrogen fixation protein